MIQCTQRGGREGTRRGPGRRGRRVKGSREPGGETRERKERVVWLNEVQEKGGSGEREGEER